MLSNSELWSSLGRALLVGTAFAALCTVTLFTAHYAIKLSFETQIFTALHGFLRGNPRIEPGCQGPYHRRLPRAGLPLAWHPKENRQSRQGSLRESPHWHGAWNDRGRSWRGLFSLKPWF